MQTFLSLEYQICHHLLASGIYLQSVQNVHSYLYRPSSRPSTFNTIVCSCNKQNISIVITNWLTIINTDYSNTNNLSPTHQSLKHSQSFSSLAHRSKQAATINFLLAHNIIANNKFATSIYQ